MVATLVIGGGGREHTIAWKLAESIKVTKVYVAPGNGGTNTGKLQNVSLPMKAPFAEVVTFCKDSNIDLVIVGPEQPLVDGITDVLEAAGIKIFGPSKLAARVEGSKAFSKDFFAKYKVPTAKYQTFKAGELDAAKSWVKQAGFPVVVKASGLCAGKGVLIPEGPEETEKALEAMLTAKEFGEACDEVVVEQRLDGREVSIFGICDGKDFVTMIPAMDHKRAKDGDQGLNTGGMGAVAPITVAPEVIEQIRNTIFAPTMEGFIKEGCPYKGVLYAGLMLDKDGKNPNILEYNCRFGDPETEVVLPLLSDDLYDLLSAASVGRLKEVFPDGLQFRSQHCVTVVIAAEGYPESYPKGMLMNFPATIPSHQTLFHAGTAQKDGQIITSGGRIIMCSAHGENRAQAIEEAYKLVDNVKFDNKYYRTDIGQTKNAV